MVYAEKIVTAIDRGTTNTRWRDFADIHLLSRRHTVDGTKLAHSIRGVAGHRRVRLIPLVDLLADYGATNQEVGDLATPTAARGPAARAIR